MRKLLLIILLLSLTCTAKAEVIAHRYRIPNTNYSIELNKEFSVYTRDADETSPIVVEHDVSIESVMDFMSYAFDDLVAFGRSYFHGSVFISSFEPIDVLLPSKDIAPERLDELGEVFASEYYKQHSEFKPFGVSGDLCSTVTLGENQFVTWMYFSEYAELTEVFLFWDKDCSILISVDYEGSTEEITDAAVKTLEILRTIKKDTM